MKAIFENITAVIATVTLSVLALSLSHEYGYFWIVGRQFQTFLTTTDYLANGVLWLPLAVLSIFAWIDQGLLKDEPSQPWDWKERRTQIGVGLFAVLTLLVFWIYSWPPDWGALACLMIWFVYVWRTLWRYLAPVAHSDDAANNAVRQLVRLGPPFIFGIFLIGAANAGFDLTRYDSAYKFKFDHDDSTKLRVFLRNFDKGILVRDAVENRIEFHKWNEVTAVSKPVGDAYRPFCNFTGWNCRLPETPSP